MSAPLPPGHTRRPAEAARAAEFDAAPEPPEIRGEQVARAICEADFDVDGCRWSWDDADWPAREDYRRMARAAIAALDAPDEEANR